MANEDDARAGGEADDDASSNNGSGDGSGLLSALKSKEILIPAAVSAVGAVAATAGPSLLRKVTSTAEEKGEEEAENLGRRAVEGAKEGLTGGGGGKGMAGKLLSKALPGGGGGGGSGGKKTRRLPIQRWTDVAVPVDRAYSAWLDFDKYPRFMHRVLNVEEKGRDRLSWQEKIWFSKRQWEGRITDKRENDRIAWKTTSGMSHKGVVTFHRLDDALTRVMVDMEFEPNGIMEKMASGLRFVKRAVQADLARFKAYVEMEDAKGIEYRPVRDDEDDEKQQQQRGESRSGRSDDGRSDEERDSERQERESRREERRRETAGSR
jgi:hypothetical protein